jgi:toxin YoeB
MKIAFEKVAFADFTAWAEQDRKIHKRIVALIMDIMRNPHQGIGKPEPLKHELQGYWSRRINDEHRLIYCIETETITIIACKHHYE